MEDLNKSKNKSNSQNRKTYLKLYYEKHKNKICVQMKNIYKKNSSKVNESQDKQKLSKNQSGQMYYQRHKKNLLDGRKSYYQQNKSKI